MADKQQKMAMRRFALIVWCIAVGVLPASLAHGASLYSQQAELTYTPLGEAFGISVAVTRDGNTAVVGDPIGATFQYVQGGPVPSSGTIQIFRRSGGAWNLVQTLLTDSDPNHRDGFGEAVAISRDGATIAAGARTWSNSGAAAATGAVYVFARGANGLWAQQTKLIPSDGSQNEFGASVAINDASDTIVVGHFGSPGAAFIFRRSGATWTEEQRIPPPGDSTYFGWSVAVSADGTLALIGAKTSTYGGPGSAYIFVRSGAVWTQQQRFDVPEVGVNGFGTAVALSADGATALVGADYDVGPPNNTVYEYGRAYVFTRSGASWTYQQRLVPDDVRQWDRFGWSVAISDDGSRAIVGTWPDGANSTPPVSPGSAYVFRRSGGTWSELDKLTAADGVSSDEFGYATATNGDGTTVLVGAPSASVGAAYQAGKAYVYIIPPPAPVPPQKPGGPPAANPPAAIPVQRPAGQPAGQAPAPAPPPRP